MLIFGYDDPFDICVIQNAISEHNRIFGVEQSSDMVDILYLNNRQKTVHISWRPSHIGIDISFLYSDSAEIIDITSGNFLARFSAKEMWKNYTSIETIVDLSHASIEEKTSTLLRYS